MEFFTLKIQPLLAWLNNHPNWAGFITFLISFSESLAIIGSIVPGSVTMTAVGILIGSGVIPAYSTFFWAILGAIAGDSASYYLGYHFYNRISDCWPFRKHPQIIKSGKLFFSTHGGKSVFIGRFLGPLRSIIPVVAGMMRMSNHQFLIANSTSAILWSGLYILPGVFLGVAASELSVNTATKLLLYVLLGLLITWLVAWVVKWAITNIKNISAKYLQTFWLWLSVHPRLNAWAKTIADPQKPQSPIQLCLFFLLHLTSVLFIICAVGVINHGLITSYNHEILSMLQSIRTMPLDMFFLGISITADKIVIIPVFIAGSLYFVYKRDWWTTIHWVSNGFISALFIFIIKHFSNSIRPIGFNIIRSGSSFPSGHTAFTTAIIGFFVYLLIKSTSQTMRRFTYIPSLFFLFLVGTSRLYVGAHWFTDVLSSYLLASSITFFHILSYQRHHRAAVNKLELSVVILVTWTIVASSLMFIDFQNKLYGIQPIIIKHQTQYHKWWQSNQSLLPTTRRNRAGKTTETFNIQWAGNIDKIKAHLLGKKWKEIRPHTLSYAVNQILTKKKYRLPLLPQLYHNHRPSITFVFIKNDYQYTLRLWRSHYQFTDSKHTLWVGTLNNDKPSIKKIIAPSIRHKTLKTRGKVIHLLVQE